MVKQHLYLIGYRGCGKSTVAGLVARTLGLNWVDTDVLVESETRRTIREIFAQEGEATFRDLESRVLEIESGKPPQVIALGGGAILRQGNRQRIKHSGQVVWLQAAPEVLAARIVQDPQTAERRPSLTGRPVLDEIREVLQQRKAWYTECANLTLDANTAAPAEIADQICQWWASGKGSVSEAGKADCLGDPSKQTI